MASTLSRNAVIEARSQGLPAGLQSYQRRERLAQHNPENARLFLTSAGATKRIRVDWGCTDWDGWCTSSTGSSFDGMPNVAKFRIDAGQARSDPRRRQQPLDRLGDR